MKRLGGWDAVLLYNETPNLPQHTLKIGIVDAADCDGFGYNHYRQTLARKLHLLEPLRYRLVDIPRRLHRAMWLENCDIDLDYHVRRLQIRPPGGRLELDAAIGDIASTALDRSKPLWEFHFVEGMADNRFAIIGKVHHALADGVASANLMARALDFPGASWPDKDNYRRDPLPSDGQLIRAAMRDHAVQLRELPGLLQDTIKGIRRVRRTLQVCPGVGPQLPSAGDLPQPRRDARTHLRQRHAATRRRQKRRQASRSHHQRHGVGHHVPERFARCC